jgi:hypothetical protein
MTQTELYRLQPDGRRLVGEAFMRGEVTVQEIDVHDFLEPLDHSGRVDLMSLDEHVEKIVANHEKYSTDMDGLLAPEVHRALDVSRRVASDPALWHWLSVVKYPDFVRHRWKYRSEEAMREKFLGAGSDLYSNAIHRLWWISELTHGGDDYDLTRKVFENQTIVNKVFDRWFARYEPAVKVLCRELIQHPSWMVDEVTTRFNHTLTNLQLEGMNEDDVQRVVNDIVADATRES